MTRLILSAALILSLSAMVHAQRPTKGARLHVGGVSKKANSGQITFKLNGGAGKNPQFVVGSGNNNRFSKISRRATTVGSYPVAVGGHGCCGHNYFGDGGFSNLYNQGFIPVPPYFALHPPVYYSAPVPRSYGYSPFAYPGTVPTPDVVLGPEEIVNPYVDPEAEGEEVPVPPQEASQQTASAPHVIRNPFVEQAQVVSFTAGADLELDR